MGFSWIRVVFIIYLINSCLFGVEYSKEFKDLRFEFVTLCQGIGEPEILFEDFDKTWANAVHNTCKSLIKWLNYGLRIVDDPEFEDKFNTYLTAQFGHGQQSFQANFSHMINTPLNLLTMFANKQSLVDIGAISSDAKTENEDLIFGSTSGSLKKIGSLLKKILLAFEKRK